MRSTTGLPHWFSASLIHSYSPGAMVCSSDSPRGLRRGGRTRPRSMMAPVTTSSRPIPGAIHCAGWRISAGQVVRSSSRPTGRASNRSKPGRVARLATVRAASGCRRRKSCQRRRGAQRETGVFASNWRTCSSGMVMTGGVCCCRWNNKPSPIPGTGLEPRSQFDLPDRGASAGRHSSGWRLLAWMAWTWTGKRFCRRSSK